MSGIRIRLRCASVLALLALASCQDDDVDRPGTWRPTGSNAANLQAMVAVPSHLENGVGASTDRGNEGSGAVTRLLEDRRRALPITRTTNSFSAGASTGAASGGR